MKKWTLLWVFIVQACFLWSNEVTYYWCGAVTPVSAKVTCIIQNSSSQVRLVVSKEHGFTNPIYSPMGSADPFHDNAVTLEITDLTPGTFYYYAIEIDGVLDDSPDDIGSFTTFINGPFSYSFVAASCNFFPNNEVYNRMRLQSPLFYIMSGDMHYADPSSSDVQVHRDAYANRVLSQPAEQLFFQRTPFAYVWDDHDFCGNNNDGTSGCGEAAKQAYLDYIPYYPLGCPNHSNAIYQAFTVGRIRFIMSDLRSERVTGDIMSPVQFNWLKSELIQARDNGQLICWVSSVSYSGNIADNWGGYASTRTQLANFLRDNQIANMFIISGDAHMLAIDNGTHSDFCTGGPNPFQYPILQSAALNNIGSDKGGTYSEGGTFPNPLFASQWTEVKVTDNGGTDICVAFYCYRWNTITNSQSLVTSYQFCRTLPYAPVLANQVEETNSLRIIPNPVQQMMKAELDFQGKAVVKIIDYTGRQYLCFKDVPVNGSFTLDVSSIAAGSYYLLVETDKGNFISALIKN